VRANAQPAVFAWSDSDEAIHSFFSRRNGLLRGACHRARISRDPLARSDEGTHDLAIPSGKSPAILAAASPACPSAETSRGSCRSRCGGSRDRYAVIMSGPHNSFVFRRRIAIDPCQRASALTMFKASMAEQFGPSPGCIPHLSLVRNAHIGVSPCPH
jgi:hypothetical protein